MLTAEAEKRLREIFHDMAGPLQLIISTLELATLPQPISTTTNFKPEITQRDIGGLLQQALILRENLVEGRNLLNRTR